VNWAADENIDSIIVQRLREAGHEVWYVPEAHPGLDDDSILREVERLGAILLTADKDFAARCFRRRPEIAGVVLLRLAGVSATEKAARLMRAVSEEDKRLLGAFTVVSVRTWRVRSPRRPV
jgi:predicted nuclease of predicted toxin-antitoxin system